MNIYTHTHITELLCYTLGTNSGSDSKELACDVGDPGGEDSLEKNTATHSGILAWRIPVDKGAWRAAVHGSQRVGHD